MSATAAPAIKTSTKVTALLIVLIPAAVWLLSGSWAAALIVFVLALSVATAQPLYVALGAVTLVSYQYLSEIPPIDYGIFPEMIFGLTDKNVLLAIPFFVVAGAIMTEGGIAKRLVDFAGSLTYWLPGGLAIASIGACVLFAAISGSSPVTVIAIGGMMYPALVKSGFGERASIGLLSSAGSLGIVIPPSIPMIIFAITVSGMQPVDVGDLFLAGVGPGLLIGSILAGYVVVQALRRSTNRSEDLRKMGAGFLKVGLPVLLTGPVGAFFVARKAFLEGFWALLLPVLILGGIYTGFFTPTEAAAVAVVYALVVAIYIYREITWKDLPALIVESTILMGSLIVIMIIAFVFNDFLVEEQVPDKAAAFVQSLDMGRFGFLIVLNIFLLIVGCFMDIISAILIIAPLVVPMAMAPGIDVHPIHLGIIFIVNLEIGYLTPPLGLNLFVASTLFRKSLGDVIRAVVPYTLMMMVGVLIITYVPALSLAPGEWLTALGKLGTTEEKVIDEPSQETPGKVLSIEELMNQANGEDDEDLGELDEDDDDPNAGKVLSIEELMKQADEAEEPEALDDTDDPDTADPDTADPDTADPVTADPDTADPDTDRDPNPETDDPPESTP